MATLRLLILLAGLALLLAACAAPGGQPDTPAPAPAAVEGASSVVDRSCTTDADCTVKNVGNCCGYYPACVNADSPTNPEAVQAACAASGRAGVCGFPEISGCQCVQGTCQDRRREAIVE